MPGPDCRVREFEWTPGGWRVWCRCGWDSMLFPTRDQARQAHWFHRHGAEPVLEEAVRLLRDAGMLD